MPDTAIPAAQPAHYERLGTLPLEAVLEAIRGPESKAMFLGMKVGVSSLRLQTFARDEPVCSDPSCCLQATHFAVERNFSKSANPDPLRPYHLNLYGVNAFGHEVLFTHDHTLARGLGGSDSLDNTTIMCTRCNSKKSVLEHVEVKRRRMANGLDPNGKPHTHEEEDESIGVRRQERQLEHVKAMAAVRGMDLEVYKTFCNDEGSALKPACKAKKTHRKLAAVLGMTYPAYRYFRHDHNQHQIKLRQDEAPAVSSKSALAL